MLLCNKPQNPGPSLVAPLRYQAGYGGHAACPRHAGFGVWGLRMSCCGVELLVYAGYEGRWRFGIRRFRAFLFLCSGLWGVGSTEACWPRGHNLQTR